MPSAPKTVIEKSPARSEASDLSPLKLLLYAVFLGTSLYALNHIGVFSGAMLTPFGLRCHLYVSGLRYDAVPDVD